MRAGRRRAWSIAVAVATVGLVPLTVTGAEAAPAAGTLAPGTLGTSAATAAGSCWEIKQQRPTAADGAYWLLTPRMNEPGQFYCDMTTDGGGWVLVGKGRDGWTDAYEGKGRPADLLTPDLPVMGSATAQHSSETIDALLDGGRVDALADGIRLRRATDPAGTTWQEVRFSMARRDRWAWTFAAEHPVRAWSFDGDRGGTGVSSATFGSDSALKRVVTTAQASQQYRFGFAFGPKTLGSSSPTSYLWSFVDNGGGALPYTQVYLRPKVLSTDAGFTRIGDAGTGSTTRPRVPSSRALDGPWGVSGIAGNTAAEGDVEVQAFTQSGNTMYVGGNFATVQQDATGTGSVGQPFLAAFDVTTGAFVSSFRPALNEQVHALTTLPDGTVVAGGEFTRANGTKATQLVALDPVTGATRAGWNLTVENRVTSGAPPLIRSLDVQGGWLYLAGALTHLTGGSSTKATAAKNLGRVKVADGTPDTTWNPKLNGTVNDVDASSDGSRVYAAGYFSTANGQSAYRAAVLSSAAGAAVTPFSPTWSSTKNDYQRSVLRVADRVYFGGSQHSLFGYDPTTMNRVSGSIMKAHGDIQVIAPGAPGVILAGCHCNNYSYQGAFTWPSLGPSWTEADALNWFGAWDAVTGARIPQFVPQLASRLGSGIWAIATDSRGVVWAGGDITTATTKSAARRWTGGFARFDAADSTAPAAPTGLQVTGSTDQSVTLSWRTVSDQGGGVRYQVLRDDRPVGSTTGNTGSLTVDKGGSNRFFVRAVDAAGNLSASTPVVLGG